MKKNIMKKFLILFIVLFASNIYAENPSYEISLSASGNKLLSEARFGVSENATDYYDSLYDAIFFSSHSASGEYVDVFLDNSSMGEENYKYLYIQKNSVDSNIGWKLKVQTKTAIGSQIKLTWSPKTTIPNDVTLTLVDLVDVDNLDDDISINMLTKSEYIFKTQTAAFYERSFVIQETILQVSDDTDGDEMPDSWELLYGFDPNNSIDATLDADGDKLTNLDEYIMGTDPYQVDTDIDGVIDSLDPDPNDPSDNKPFADAGADQISGPTTIVLDGSQSSDPKGDSLIYTWGQDIYNPEIAAFSKNMSSDAVITQIILRKSGSYIFPLMVYDGYQNSTQDYVNVEILNIPPNASAGNDFNLFERDAKVTVDASESSDANGDSLTYFWSIVSKPSNSLASLDNVSIAAPSFYPDRSGIYTLKLIVNDGVNESLPSKVNIIANFSNVVPTAFAGENQIVSTGDLVVLSGAKSSDGGDGPDALTYSWSQIWDVVPHDVPAVTLSDSTSSSPTFIPNQSGTYKFELIVNDGENSSLPDSVIITVNDPQNNVPLADAGVDKNVMLGEMVILGGGASFDKDLNDTLSYQWEQRTGTTVTLINGTNLRTMVINFIPLYAGRIDFRLRVYDGKDYSQWDTVNVIVTDNNTPPVADSGDDMIGKTGDVIALDGSGSYDLNQGETNSLIYIWSQLEGPIVSLPNPSDKITQFITNQAGFYKFSLIVRDIKGASSLPDYVEFTINSEDNTIPVAVSGNDQLVKAGTKVILDGSKSYDPDGDIITFKWVQENNFSINAGLDSKTSKVVSFTSWDKGSFTFSLIVNDGKVDSKKDFIDVNVIAKEGTINKITKFDNNLIIPDAASSLEGVEVSIPKGAILYDTAYVGINKGENLSDMPDNITIVGNVIDLSPAGMKFSRKINIKMPIPKAKLQSVSYDIAALKAYGYNKETKTWDPISLNKIENEKGYAEFETDHFSTYALGTDLTEPVGAEPVSAAPIMGGNTGDSGGGGGCFLTVIK